jgi:type IV pilus assembly protein PilA
MKSAKCLQCGFVGWSDVEYCKACGAPLSQGATNYAPASPASNSWSQAEVQKKGLAIFSLVLGIISFFTFGLLGVGAIAGIILAAIAMSRAKREPWKYGGRGMAIAGLVLSITSLATVIPVGIVASLALPNLLAARMAANEASALQSLRTISSAEMYYQSQFQRYGTLQELATLNLIDQKLGSGVKNGYRFTVELTSAEGGGEGFAVSGVPTEYRSSGRRSFYVDETFVIRAADNQGSPSSISDAPLDATPVRQNLPQRYQTDNDL